MKRGRKAKKNSQWSENYTILLDLRVFDTQRFAVSCSWASSLGKTLGYAIGEQLSTTCSSQAERESSGITYTASIVLIEIFRSCFSDLPPHFFAVSASDSNLETSVEPDSTTALNFIKELGIGSNDSFSYFLFPLQYYHFIIEMLQAFDSSKLAASFPMLKAPESNDIKSPRLLLKFSEIPSEVLQHLNYSPQEGRDGEEKTDEEERDIIRRLQNQLPTHLFSTLKPFQLQAVCRAIKCSGRLLFGDEMGLGKTLQALCTAFFYRSEWPLLVVCPSSLTATWENEICRWLEIKEEGVKLIKKLSHLRQLLPSLLKSFSHAPSKEESRSPSEEKFRRSLSNFVFHSDDQKEALRLFKAQKEGIIEVIIISYDLLSRVLHGEQEDESRDEEREPDEGLEHKREKDQEQEGVTKRDSKDSDDESANESDDEAFERREEGKSTKFPDRPSKQPRLEDLTEKNLGGSSLELLFPSFQVIICDESHYLKNQNTQRTRAILPLLKSSRRCLLLSGTPALSRPVELFTQLNALRSDIFPSLNRFGQRYCDAQLTFWGWNYNGGSNLSELHALLNQTVMVRRKKSDVFRELPAKVRQCVVVDVDEGQMENLRLLTHQCVEIERELQSMERSARPRLEMSRRGLLMKMYCETGRVKLKACLDYLHYILKEVDKLLVFAHHKEVLAGIWDWLRKSKIRSVQITGETPMLQRSTLCQTFQQDTECRVAVLGITVGALGLTLHSANVVVFTELFWNPGQLLQAEDRVHRIGQQHQVTIKYLVARGTIDDLQWPLVQYKLEMVGQSLDGAGTHQLEVQSPDSQERKIVQSLLVELLNENEVTQAQNLE